MHISASHFIDLIQSLQTAQTLTSGNLVDLTALYERGFPHRNPAAFRALHQVLLQHQIPIEDFATACKRVRALYDLLYPKDRHPSGDTSPVGQRNRQKPEGALQRKSAIFACGTREP